MNIELDSCIFYQVQNLVACFTIQMHSPQLIIINTTAQAKILSKQIVNHIKQRLVMEKVVSFPQAENSLLKNVLKIGGFVIKPDQKICILNVCTIFQYHNYIFGPT